MENESNDVSFSLARVPKLAGKPEDFTPPDREFEARRIQLDYYATCLPFLAVESRACRTHSDLLCGDLAIAACNSLSSSGERRAFTIMPRNLDLGTFGLPIFGFINTLCKTKINVDTI
jgi:hypothetical protein